MTGVYGKLPSYGDFLRRELPSAFLAPWDAWLQAGMAATHAAWGDTFAQRWAAAPAWRFCLPAGICGPQMMAGVLLPSQDAVGRHFPLTLATALAPGQALPAVAWFEEVERLGTLARDRSWPMDELIAALPQPWPRVGGAGGNGGAAAPVPPPSSLAWWTAQGRQQGGSDLPTARQFVALMSPVPAAGPLSAEGVTDRGTVRSRNEDAFVDRGDIGLWAVADGAGGHGAGDVASSAVAAALQRLPAGLSAGELLAQVRLSLAEVHTTLQAAADDSAHVFPATTVVAFMANGGHFACLWAGDSRAYLLRDGKLCQLTRDHSLLQELIDAGSLTAAEAENHPQANVITRAIGGPEDLQLEKVAGRLAPGDRVMLCTDGVFKAIPEPVMADLLRQGTSAGALIARCLEAGAKDNVTVVFIDVAGCGDG